MIKWKVKRKNLEVLLWAVPLNVGRLMMGEKFMVFFIKTIAKPSVMAEILKTIAKFGLTIVHLTIPLQ